MPSEPRTDPTPLVPAGWLPHPNSQGQLRFWDGTVWTNQVAPSPPSAPSTQSGPRKRSWLRRVAWGTVGSFIIGSAVVGYAMSRGQDVKRIKPSGEIEFYSTKEELSAQEIRPQQQNLEKRVSELEQEAKNQSASQVATPTSPDLRGNWTGENGLTYTIQQYGDQVVIEEITPYGITAVGQGRVEGDSLNFDYQSLDGSYGRALFSINGDTLQGSFNNDYYQVSVPAVLYRE